MLRLCLKGGYAMGVFFVLVMLALIEIFMFVFMVLLVCLGGCLITIGLSGAIMDKIELKRSISLNNWGSLFFGIMLSACTAGYAITWYFG
jgi:hypothetical protein